MAFRPLVSTVGGASGPLYGTFFMQAGAVSVGKQDLSAADWGAALEAAVNGVVMRGRAVLGDKTMVDALPPALEAFKDAVVQNATIGLALTRSVQAAEEGMKATIPLVARKGRASYLGERSGQAIESVIYIVSESKGGFVHG